MESYTVVGMMSGTSLDGLDIACCTFERKESWKARIDVAETVPYPKAWVSRLSGLMKADAAGLARTSVEYGHYIGKNIQTFIDKNSLSPLFVSSHGHTIFHQPEQGYTLQVGDGSAVAAELSLPVVYDFRSLDVARGGQGAPLVPIGDRMLFGSYDYCLNLGGIGNISYETSGQRLAFDICPANMALNYLAGMMDLPFDSEGKVASLGTVDRKLFDRLNGLDYYSASGAKTLGREWFEYEFLPLILKSTASIPDKLATLVEHIAHQVSRAISPEGKKKKMLVTGGGAHNRFLVSKIETRSGVRVSVPERLLVDYKEALIFAFLGVLRWRNEINCLASVTGAQQDSCVGSIVFG